MNKSDSPYGIDRIMMGEKADAPDSTGQNFESMGQWRVTSAPYTLFDVNYQAAIWAPNPNTGIMEPLQVDAPVYSFGTNDEGNQTVTVEFEFTAPGYAVDQLFMMHDFNAYEYGDTEQSCSDGADDDNDGDIDCDDTDCTGAPVCGGDGGNNTNGGTNGNTNGGTNGNTNGGGDGTNNGGDGGDGGDQDPVRRNPATDEGCACSSTSGDADPAGSLLLLGLGLVALRRRRKAS
jgi:MYXO-CTERM domain-containing protein